MPGEKRSFQPKIHEELVSQLSAAERTLGSEFFPNDEKKAEVLDMDVKTIKHNYPYRYEQYLKLIKEAKGNGTPEQELISIRKYITLINNLEDHIASYEKDKPEGFLRDHQRDVFHKIAEFLNKGHKAGYLDLPTGFGKTVLFVELVKALSKGKEKQKSTLKTLVLVPTQDLVIQTIGKNKDSKKIEGFAKFAPDINVTAYYEGVKDLSGDVVVSTYQSFLNLQKENPKFTEQFDLVILDEAHKGLGEATKEQIQAITPNALKIGCTATSEYNEGKKVSDILPELIHKMEVKEAVELGILANPRGFLYRTHIKIQGKTGTSLDYPAAVLIQLNTEARNKATVDFVKTFVARGIRGLVPCLPGDEGQYARDMADRISVEDIIDKKTHLKRKIKVRSITERTSKEERNEIYDAFKSEEIDCITYIDILTTGKDLPNAKFLVRNRPRKSKIASIQEIGRLLRPFEGEDPYVVEIEDEFPTGENPYTIFDLFEVEEINQGQQMVAPAEIVGPEDESIPAIPAIELVVDDKESQAEIPPPQIEPPVLPIQTIQAEDFTPPLIPTEEQSRREQERLEREERNRELTRELLGKMSVEVRLVRELSRKELKKVDYGDKNQLKILLSFSDPLVENLFTISLFDFTRTKFGGRGSGFTRVTGQTILLKFGSGKPSAENLRALLKFIGNEVRDYSDPEYLKKLLSFSNPKLNDWTKANLETFRSTQFGGGLSGMLAVRGRSILLNTGNRQNNTVNLNNLIRLLGFEVNEKFDYTNPEQIRLLLSYSNPKIIILAHCDLKKFLTTKFGDKKQGLPEIVGHTILKNFGSGVPDLENLGKLLAFVNLESKDFSNPEYLRELVASAQPKIDNLATCGVTTFLEAKFGGHKPEFPAMTGRAVLSRFGNGGLSTEDFSGFLKFIGIEVLKSIDYNDRTQLKKLLSYSTVPLSSFREYGFTKFIELSFGGTDSGFTSVSGRVILRNFGDRKSNTANFQNLLEFLSV